MTKEVNMATVAADVPDPTPATPEAVPEAQNRPDWLLSNFTNVEDQAKAYVELRKTFGAQKGAPEEYDYGDLAQQVDLDNQHLKEFQLWAKENRLSQDAFHKTIKTFVEYDQSRRPDVDKEIAKLGDKGIEIVKGVQNWVKNALTPESQKALESLPVNANVIKMLDELRQRHVHTMSRVPTDVTVGDFQKLTVQEVEAEMMQNYSRYQADAGYRKQIEFKFTQALGDE